MLQLNKDQFYYHLIIKQSGEMLVLKFVHVVDTRSDTQFIDLCILLGCDYCDSIRGIGPKKAVELINKHRSLENIIANLDKSVSVLTVFQHPSILFLPQYCAEVIRLTCSLQKYPIPEGWLYKEARQLFQKPEVTDASEVEVMKLWVKQL